MRVAIEGCSHGELDAIYASIAALDARASQPAAAGASGSSSTAAAAPVTRTQLLLLCGDVQAARNAADLSCIAMPDKYLQLGDFAHYYSGVKVAPILTLVIGGNHEASNYMHELYHGGWLAPNIYYLGAAGCVEVGGLRIAGISGIYKSHDFTRGRYETLPYDRSAVRSIYHTRVYDSWRLSLLADAQSRPHVVMSHDWPNTIEQHGDTQALIRRKPFFKDEINTSTLGSPPLWELLRGLAPDYWFSAHLHVRFAALYKHDGSVTTVASAQGKQSGGPSNNAAASSSALPPAEEAAAPRARTWGGVPVVLDAGAHDAEGVPDESVEAEANPDEIEIEMSPSPQPEAALAPDAAVEAASAVKDDMDEDPPHAVASGSDAAMPLDATRQDGETRFLALSKCMVGQDFLQILDIPAPFDNDDSYALPLPPAPVAAAGEPLAEGMEPAAEAAVDGAGPSNPAPSPPRLPTFRHVAHWLAVTRATHSYLSLTRHQPAMPAAGSAQMREMVQAEETWVHQNLSSRVRGEGEVPPGADVHPLAIAGVQAFVHTAPPVTVPEGSAPGPPPYYTNPQTEALCAWLQIPNRINAPPPMPGAPSSASAPGLKRGPPSGSFPGVAGLPQKPAPASEEEEIRRIQMAAKEAMSRKRSKTEDGNAALSATEERPPVMTLDEDDGIDARWKEGSG